MFIKSLDRLRRNIIDKGIRRIYCDGWYCKKLGQLLEGFDIEIYALHIYKKANIYKGIEFTKKDCLIISEYMINTLNNNTTELINKAKSNAGLVAILTEDRRDSNMEIKKNLKLNEYIELVNKISETLFDLNILIKELNDNKVIEIDIAKPKLKVNIKNDYEIIVLPQSETIGKR